MNAPASRILFVGNNLLAGGAERQWSILAPALVRRGHDVRMIALDAGGPFAATMAEGDVPCEVLGMRNQIDLAPILRSSLVRRFSPDVVISRSLSGLYVGHAIARLRRAAQLHTDHQQVGLALSARREHMTRLLARRAEAIVTVAPGQRETWLARGCAPARIHTIANGVAASTGGEPREVIRSALGLPADAVVAISVAALRAVKRHLDFARAVTLARASHPGLVGVIVGDGPERARVQAAAARSPGLHLLGHRDDVPRLLAASDIFVLASEFEASPMAILEAMAAGLPVVATAVGNVPAIVRDGQSGLLVAPRAPEHLARAIVRLAGDPAERARMGAAGARLRRERFDAETMIDHYERVIASIRPPTPATAR